MSDLHDNHGPYSQLLLLRLWTEEVPDGRIEWCGKVQHVVSGRAGSFRGFPALEHLLAGLLADSGQGHDPKAEEARCSGGPPEAPSERHVEDRQIFDRR